MEKITLKKADSIQEMERKLHSVGKKGAEFDADKYCGTIKRRPCKISEKNKG